jgi:hypothetical protein
MTTFISTLAMLGFLASIVGIIKPYIKSWTRLYFVGAAAVTLALGAATTPTPPEGEERPVGTSGLDDTPKVADKDTAIDAIRLVDVAHSKCNNLADTLAGAAESGSISRMRTAADEGVRVCREAGSAIRSMESAATGFDGLRDSCTQDIDKRVEGFTLVQLVLGGRYPASTIDEFTRNNSFTACLIGIAAFSEQNGIDTDNVSKILDEQ